MPPRAAPRRGRVVTVDGLGRRRRRNKSHGPDASTTLDLQWNYAFLSFGELLRSPFGEATLKKEAQIKTDLADLLQRKRRVLGSTHPNVLHCQRALARLPSVVSFLNKRG